MLTGETGAGKSILIDSINAILGNRTSRELVRSGAQKACIWATFESIPASVKSSWKNAATRSPTTCFCTARSTPRARAAAASTACPPRRRWCGTFRRGCSPSTASTTARA
ncbi:hypothetical protein NIA69_15120 [Gemmiger formicilis]|nr:hypothetical protein [Gemmiger formicilis]